MQQVLDRICSDVGAEQNIGLVGFQSEFGQVLGLFSACGELLYFRSVLSAADPAVLDTEFKSAKFRCGLDGFDSFGQPG